MKLEVQLVIQNREDGRPHTEAWWIEVVTEDRVGKRKTNKCASL